MGQLRVFRTSLAYFHKVKYATNNKKVTIYEVAKQAGVAISTVSRVLNASPNVSEETTEKVNQAIKNLNFRPQASARKLASRKPHMLAIYVPSFTTPYFNEVLKGVKDEIKKMGLDVIIYNTGSRNPEEAVQNFLDRGSADAAIILSIEITEPLHQIISSSNIPIVLLGSSHESYNYFQLNDYHGGYIAGEHLAKQGFERVGMITTPVPNRAAHDREQGFRQALMDHELPIHEELFMPGDSKKHAGFTEEAGYEAIFKYDKQKSFPDAVFCSSDTQSLGALYALSKLGMDVPKDIALMGYDNIMLSRYLDLTTIDQKMYRVGVQATMRMAEILTNPTDSLYQTSINPVLIERNSSKKLS